MKMSGFYTNFYPHQQIMQGITPMRGMSAYPRSVQCMLHPATSMHQLTPTRTRSMSMLTYGGHPRQVMPQNTPQFGSHNFGYHGMQRPHSQMLYAQQNHYGMLQSTPYFDSRMLRQPRTQQNSRNFGSQNGINSQQTSRTPSIPQYKRRTHNNFRSGFYKRMTDCCGIVGINSEPQKISTLKQLLRETRFIFQTTGNKDGLKHVNNIQKNKFNFNDDIDKLITTIAKTENKQDKQELISSLFEEANSPFNLSKLDDSQREILYKTLEKFENDEPLKNLKTALWHVRKLNIHV